MSNILISAIVAAVVTLLVEYLAKPSLEARKDAIMEGQRLTRSVKAKLALADHLFTKLIASWNQSSFMQVFEDSETTQSRVVATIDPVMEAVAGGQMRTSNAARYAVMAYVAMVEVWRDDIGGDDRKNAETAQEFCQLAARSLATPWWRRAELGTNRGLPSAGRFSPPRRARHGPQVLLGNEAGTVVQPTLS